MDMNFFMGCERIKGYDISDDNRRPCIAYGFDEDGAQFLVADMKTGVLCLLAIDDFAIAVHGELGPPDDDDEDKGVYITGEARKFLENIATDPGVRSFLDDLPPQEPGRTTIVQPKR